MSSVECTNCSHKNATEARFCANCGSALARACPNCGVPTRQGDKFCTACGAQIAPAKPPPGRAVERSAERRLTAVMFCDLVGSTEMSERLDPEDLRQVIRTYHDACAKAVNRYDGHVAKYLGDGVVAFFGYPTAHEDDSQRSVLAGLAVVDAIREMNPRLLKRFKTEIAVRIGIHSGVVVAGEMGSVDSPVMDIVGETPNIAARLQQLAEPNGLVVSGDTHRLTANSFRFEALGPKRLKGVTRRIPVYRVTGPTEEAPAQARRIIGRKDEVGQLERLLKASRQGQGRLALIRGEAGIGKSTLVNAILDRVQRDPEGAAIVLRCSPYHQNTPLYPVVEYLRTSQLHLLRTDPPEVQLQRLEEFADDRRVDRETIVPVLAKLLSIPFEGRYTLPLLSAEGLRLRMLETLVEMTLRRATRFAVALIVDNIHWADPTTTELFGRVLERGRDLRLFAIATFRPPFEPHVPRPPGTLELSLDRLDYAEILSLARRAAGGKELPFEILEHIAKKTDGVPLFVEELTKTIVESGAMRLAGKRYELVGSLDDLEIPTTLQGSLVARLERVAGSKDIAQLAAVVGREFTLEVVAAVAKLDETAVSNELSNLVSADLVYPVEAFTGNRAYRFRHALIQDAAYDSLLKSVRQGYHRDIARTMESRFADAAEEQPEVIAAHYSAAGVVDAALLWWSLAGSKALGRSANVEAIAHFTRGLEMLEQVAESPIKVQMELGMLAQRGTALIATKGFAAPEVGDTFRRAEAICRLIGETPLLFPVIWGLWVYHLVRSDLETSCEYAQQMLRLAEMSGESGMFVEGHFTLGDSLFWLGRLEESKEHLDEALRLYDAALHRTHTLLYGQDPGVTTLCYLSYTYWNLGLVDQAIAFVDRAYDLAQESRHPFSIGWALSFACSIRNWTRLYAEARPWAERCVEYCEEQGHAFWASAAVGSLGVAMFRTGDRQKGIELLRQGLAGYEMTGSIVVSPLWRSLLAEMLIETGALEEAEKLVDQGLATVADHHEWVTEPFLRRLRGDVLAARGEKEAAKREYLRAFDQAESQRSLMRALQAAKALVRLTDDEDAMRRLRSVLARFTEGFEAPDVAEAQQMLESWKMSTR